MDASANPIELKAEIEELREMPRCAVDASVTLVQLARGTMMVGRMTELGLSGCRVILPKSLTNAVSSAVECTFRIHGVAFRLGGVIHSIQDNLVGLEFSTMSSRNRDDLVQVLCEVGLENHASPPSAAPPPRAEIKLPAKSALQASIAAPARVLPMVHAPAQQIVAVPAQSALPPRRGRDRRAAHRCGVDTSALIDLINVGSKLSGQIVDLSVGGCRIRTTEKFPVGIYTRVETEFQLHGLPFRLGGVIQAIHDRNTVGIRFLDMSDRKRNQVAELVEEMDESQS
jgi:c-di-GMP-binding flagellar brake protein YcgR